MSSDSSKSYGIGDEGATAAITAVPVFGKSRNFGRFDWKEWAFLFVSVVNILTSVGLTIDRLVQIRDETSSPDFTFAILLLVNAAFCLFYVVHGLLREREFELYAYSAAILVVLGYCILEYATNVNHRNTVKLARLISACILAPVNVVLAGVVAYQFGWLEFRIVGASEALQFIYRETTRYSCLLKFNFQVSVSLAVLVLQNGTSISTVELVIICIGIPYAFLWMFLGYYTMTWEMMSLVAIFILTGMALPGYIIYKIFDLYHSYYFETHHFSNSQMSLIYSTLAACAIGCVVHILVFIELSKIIKNFGKGLKERLFNSDVNERTSLLAAARV